MNLRKKIDHHRATLHGDADPILSGQSQLKQRRNTSANSKGAQSIGIDGGVDPVDYHSQGRNGRLCKALCFDCQRIASIFDKQERRRQENSHRNERKPGDLGIITKS